MLFSFWIVTGQLLTQRDPPYLPMSHDNCSFTTTNITITNATLQGTLTTTVSSVTTLAEALRQTAENFTTVALDGVDNSTLGADSTTGANSDG